MTSSKTLMWRSGLVASAALLGLLIAPAAPAADMTLDQVLAKHYEAIGGEAAWKNIKTMRTVGKMTMGPMEMPISITVARPNKMRMEFEMQGMKAVQAFDGSSGWQIMPFQGSTEPEPMDPEMLKNLESDADIEGVLIGYAEKGHKVELMGKEDFEGTEAYHLKVTMKSGREMSYFLDAEYFVPIGRRESQSIPGMGEMEITSSISDYKEVNGLMVPHSISGQSPMGEQNMTFTSIEVDPEVDPTIFAMPKSEGN
jgi:outer membrane lipoprotein-sorting protein